LLEGVQQAMVTQQAEPYALRDPVLKALERTKWYLWHGNVFRALQEIESITMDLDAAGQRRRIPQCGSS